MAKQEINLENISDFLAPVETIEDIKKLKSYKELKVSPISFYILRYFFQKYMRKGEGNIYVADLIEHLSKSSKFEFLTNGEKENNQYMEEELPNVYQEYNEIDIFEESVKDIENIKYIENIYELIQFGYLALQNQIGIDKDMTYFKIITNTVNVTIDFLELINNGELKPKKYENKTPFKDYKEYLKEVFEYIELKQGYLALKTSLDKKSPVLINQKENYENLKKQLEKRISKKMDFENPLERFFEKNKITEKQKDIFFSLLKVEYDKDFLAYTNEKNMIRLYFEEMPEIISEEERYFGINKDFINIEYSLNPFTNEGDFFYYLSDEILDDFMIEKSNEEKKKEKATLKQVEKLIKGEADFEIIEPNQNYETIILSKETEELIKTMETQLDEKIFEKLQEWGLKTNNKIEARVLFSGDPGTGKTATAHVIASTMDKYILSFDCSKILSMYIGESEKNVKKIFDTYKKLQTELNYSPILLLNEADQFLSTRTSHNSSADKMHNQMQNIFLEEFEKFEGILIATTNLKDNIDKAFSRRFNYKIEFKKPDYETRLRIWKQKIPKQLPKKKDFDFETLAKYELTGGEIDLIVKNTAMYNATNNKNKFEEDDFIKFIKKEKENSFDIDSKKLGFLN